MAEHNNKIEFASGVLAERGGYSGESRRLGNIPCLFSMSPISTSLKHACNSKSQATCRGDGAKRNPLSQTHGPSTTSLEPAICDKRFCADKNGGRVKGRYHSNGAGSHMVICCIRS